MKNLRATLPPARRSPKKKLFKLWEGLGYYSRARNLHATAKHIAFDLNNSFPETYEGIRQLKGVGDYTAAAIASFAYRLPHAVVDGNVYRVLSRVFGIETPIDSPAGKREFTALAHTLLDRQRPDRFNQAMMDFGATHCLPRLPKCAACPFTEQCAAWKSGRVGELPVKGKTMVRKDRFFLYLVFRQDGDTFIRQREGKDIWQHLWEFPVVELPVLPLDRAEAEREINRHFFPAGLPEGLHIGAVSQPLRQTLTHRNVAAVFCEISLPAGFQNLDFQNIILKSYRRISFEKLKKNVALPRLIDWYLQGKSITYSLF